MEIGIMKVAFNHKPPMVLNLVDLKDAEISVSPHITLRVVPNWVEGVISVNVENRKLLDDKITKAYNEFMTRLFGEVPKNTGRMTVEKELYTKELNRVQERYGLHQGDPEFLEWVLTLVGRSPILTSEGEIVYDTGNAEDAGENPPVGEAPPSQTE